MIVGRIIGWILIVLALGVAGWELFAFFADGKYVIHSLGQLWYVIDRASLNTTQAAIQRHVLPALWDPVLITILRGPAWVIFALLGLLLLWTCQPGGGKNRRWFR